MADINLRTKTPYIDSFKKSDQNSPYKGTIKQKQSPLIGVPLFHCPQTHETQINFGDTRRILGLDDYISTSILTEAQLQRLPHENPGVYAAIQRDHIAAALGIVSTQSHATRSTGPRIEMEDLQNLEQNNPMELDRIANSLETSEDVILAIKGDFNLSSVEVCDNNGASNRIFHRPIRYA